LRVSVKERWVVHQRHDTGSRVPWRWCRCRRRRRGLWWRLRQRSRPHTALVDAHRLNETRRRCGSRRPRTLVERRGRGRSRGRRPRTLVERRGRGSTRERRPRTRAGHRARGVTGWRRAGTRARQGARWSSTCRRPRQKWLDHHVSRNRDKRSRSGVVVGVVVVETGKTDSSNTTWREMRTRREVRSKQR
jgi:hypothetical protein